MPGGRPPMPIERKRRQGRSGDRDSGGRQITGTVVALPGADGIPAAPASLSTADRAMTCRYAAGEDDERLCVSCRDEIGRMAWERLWTAGRAWLSPTTDLDVLTRLCLARLDEAHLRAVLDMDGMFVKGQRGGLVSHPAVAQLRVLSAEATRLESLCGFTPTDRGRLGVAEVKHASPLEKLLAERVARR